MLDTKVLSELMNPEPPAALSFIASLADGRRRAAFEAAADAMFAHDLAGHILPFTSTGAEKHAGILATRRKAGRPIASLDALVAATALAADAGVATRDRPGFADRGRSVIDPSAMS